MTYTSRNYKAFLWDYDYLLSKSDEECCFSLSEREVQILLAQIDTIGWKTRYKPTSTEIDQDLIDRWMGNLARKLMSGCCPDDDRLSRFTEEGVFQTSDDGGETWQDNPGADPRNDYIALPPLPGSPSASKQCAAADNVRDLFLSYRDDLIDFLETAPTVMGMVATILSLIAILTGSTGAGIGISVLLIGLASQLLTLTPEAIEDAIDTIALENFKCLVYCRMDESGQLTYDAWLALLQDIASTFDGFAELFFFQTVNGMGYIGVNNAGTLGEATASDCAECDCASEWCYRFDFTGSNHGWTANYGNWTSGQGWVGVPFGTGGGLSGLQTDYAFTIHCTSIRVHSVGSGFAAGQREIWLQLDTDPMQYHVLPPDVNGDYIGQYNQAGFAPFDFDHIELYWGGSASYDMKIDWIEYHGVGANPFGEDNCI